MNNKLQQLKNHLQDVSDLQSVLAILNWDQATYMPPGGATARAQQTATLSRIAQEKLIDPAIGKLLDELTPYAESLPYDHDDAALIRVTRDEYERAIKIPPQFLAELAVHSSNSYTAWIAARPANDFATMIPYLEKTVDYSRKIADFFPGYEHIADPLIDWFDRGMTVRSLRTLFADLRAQLVPLVNAINQNSPTDDSCLHLNYPEQNQLDFGLKVISNYGYDFQRGRQDKTHHPFATRFANGDVRITTRFKENDLNDGLFSTLHEAGHGMYEQGINPTYDGSPLASGTSAGVHESQSRLWENLVGRSRGFWTHYYPHLQAVFPQQLKNISLDNFYRAINKVSPSLIRTDADEVTYNLHVLIRFDFELALLEGTLQVKDLADAWHARYEADLGVHAPNDIDGVLQDVHWYGGIVGGSFQGYTLGNILSAAFFAKAVKTHPAIPQEIAEGHFGTLHSWLKENIYQHGRKFTAPELIERVLGGGMSIDPYIHYLRQKFGDLYSL